MKNQNPSVAIIGSGMSGLCMAIKLQQAGFDDFDIYEKADSVGGTWRENTYPGLSCDVPSHYYSYSFELKSDWTNRFSSGEEIRQYLEMVADKYDVRRSIRFNTEVTECRWRGDGWELDLSDGTSTRADVVVSATGVLHHPRYPDIEGIDSFNGACFHSARWNHDVQLDGKRVGVVGNGSTAIQMVTELVSRVDTMTMFQRTAQWVAPSADKVYSDKFKKALRYVPGLQFLVYHALRIFFEQIGGRAVIRPGWQRTQVAAACRRNLKNVRDPELRAKLTPDYEPMCKRLIMSEGFYEAVQSPNCSVVTENIERVEPGGVRTADGILHELDVLVLATGFDPHAFMRPINLVGENGVTLAEAWSEAVIAYRTIALPGFPNFFMPQGPNGPVGNYSLMSVAETQCDYIVKCLRLLQSGKLQKISPRPEVCAQLEEQRIKALATSVWSTGCNSWYLDKRGIPALWPYTPDRFRRDLKTPRISEINAS
jgi:cation diffusion facilitator CzcD-associated flavoprotein CzcO